MIPVGATITVEWNESSRMVRFLLNRRVLHDWRPTGLDEYAFARLVPIVLLSQSEIIIIDE